MSVYTDSFASFVGNARRNKPESGDPGRIFQIQKKIMDLFHKGEKKIPEVMREARKMKSLTDKLNLFQDKNQNLEVAGLDVENIALRKRLQRRKWFTIVAEALLSLTAIRFFLDETISVTLPFIPTLLLGIILAYVLLDMAVEFRIDDESIDSSEMSVLDTIKRYSFILSLVLIPAINLFVIFSTPDNPLNVMYLFFAVLSFLLNLKATGYYNQYRILRNSEIAMQMNKKMENELEKQQKVLDRFTEQIAELRRQISSEVYVFRSIYEQFPSDGKPKLIIPLKYRIIINNKILHEQVLEIPPIGLINPPAGELAEAERLWGVVFDFGMNMNNTESTNRQIGPDAIQPQITPELPGSPVTPNVVDEDHTRNTNNTIPEPKFEPEPEMAPEIPPVSENEKYL